MLMFGKQWGITLLIIVGLSFDGFSGDQTLTDRFDPEVQPFAFMISHMKGVKGVPGTGLRAEECGTCHTHIYEEWKTSTHATALQDIQFQGELSKEDSPKWLCLNCHIPLQDQRAYRVTALKDGDVLKPVQLENPHFDAKLQGESITCAVCHVRPDPDSGESVIIGSFASEFAPHPIRRDPQFVRNICARCHNPKGDALTRNLVCWFHTVEELADASEKGLTTQDCVGCHMPEQERRTVPAYVHLPLRKGHRHLWTGSGIPKWFAGYDTLLERGYQSGLGVSVDAGNRDGSKATITLSNEKAGHWLPTGDPERFILVLARQLNKRGEVLHETQTRIGQEWLWSPARKVGDTRLKSGETRLWKPQLKALGRKAHRLVVTAIHVRLSTKNAAYLMRSGPIREDYLPNGNHLVKNANEHYPFASYIYREEIDLKTGMRVVASPDELIALSKKERHKPLKDRDY